MDEPEKMQKKESNADPQNETDSSYSESDEEKEYKIPTKD